ncbi:hypothetical protein PYCCODRAFT_1122612 [Trametes coccinea BRFM310]|uniref:Uncharacterized protein n=1 Tax=Trametes coccinea (strain BRFM310) TaxID=1353009 RepID=A0A1Y2ICD3_TRAC3|nr:hypothetical protein PYCCODRAFT_1122612 [Trametes coccinea BRFM310]
MQLQDSVSYSFLPEISMLGILVSAFFLPTILILVCSPARRLHRLHEIVHLMKSHLDLLVDEGRISSKTAQGLSSDLAKWVISRQSTSDRYLTDDLETSGLPLQSTP